MIREKINIYPTLKATTEGSDTDAVVLEENELIQATIKVIKNIATQYGEKTLMTVETGEGKKYNLFVNAINNNTLIDAYTENDELWLEKNIKLTIDKDKKFNKKYIKIEAV